MTALVQGPTAAQYATVVSGDTLGKIAERIYGDPKMWPALLKANPALGDGNTIYAGQKLIVPPASYAVAVKASDVLPATFAGGTQQQATINTPAYGPAPADAVVLKQSDTGALVRSASGWGVEVVTTK
jgi:LysM repeat protein